MRYSKLQYNIENTISEQLMAKLIFPSNYITGYIFEIFASGTVVMYHDMSIHKNKMNTNISYNSN